MCSYIKIVDRNTLSCPRRLKEYKWTVDERKEKDERVLKFFYEVSEDVANQLLIKTGRRPNSMKDLKTLIDAFIIEKLGMKEEFNLMNEIDRIGNMQLETAARIDELKLEASWYEPIL